VAGSALVEKSGGKSDWSRTELLQDP
jgi:hypothetical protein